MILTTHILAGALIGREINNPYAVAGLAVAVHFALDLLPHGDYLNKKSKLREFWKVAVDLTVGLGTVYAIFFIRDPISNNALYIQNIAIGIFFSLLPDGTTFLYWKMGMNFLKPLKRFHEKLHCYPNSSPKREFRLKNNLFDILISLVAIITLFSLR
jgi:hypothetical protein